MGEAKSKGFSDERIAKLLSTPLDNIQDKRRKYGILPVYKRIDTCGGEFQSEAAYLYSTYDFKALSSITVAVMLVSRLVKKALKL